MNKQEKSDGKKIQSMGRMFSFLNKAQLLKEYTEQICEFNLISASNAYRMGTAPEGTVNYIYEQIIYILQII